MSSGGTPYIGSKISLISKAKIRYEGFLYTIDTEESTVTLAKVKSFGTEDRVSDNVVPERNEIYEYIVFRGSDIDDLHVSEGPKSRAQVAQDPAIVQTGNAQPNMYHQQLPMQMGPPFPHQSYGPFGGMHTFGYPMGFRPPSSMSLSSVIGQGSISDRTQRSSPFERGYRPSPSPPTTNAIGSRHSFKDPRDKRSTSPEENHVSRSDYDKQKDLSGREAIQPKKDQKHDQLSREDEKQRDRYTQRVNYQSSNRKQSKENEPKSHYQSKNVLKDSNGLNDKEKNKDRNSDQKTAKKAVEGRSNTSSNQTRNVETKASKDSKEKERARITNSGQKKDTVQGEGTHKDDNDQIRTNSSSSERGRGRGRGNRRGKPRGRGSFGRTKFDKDFDFESANAKFNKEEVEKELLTTLKKNLTVKEDDEDVIVEKDSDRDIESDDRDNVNDDEYYYDKSKSFFDHISCDALKQKTDIMTRRKERSMNVETFGVVPWNYRGRGRPYRGRGGRGGRGRGYSRGYNNRRGGNRGENRAWVDYEFDFEAAGLQQGMNGNKQGGS